MLYKPPGAVYIASYKEPLDQSDHVLEPLYKKKRVLVGSFGKNLLEILKSCFVGVT